MIKHIFSDMDGTLLRSDCKISENNVKVIKDSQIPFTLVSARAPMEMMETIAKLGLTEPQIAFNGGLIFQEVAHEMKILRENSINLVSIQRILTELVNDFPDISPSLYDLNSWYIEKMDKGIKYEADLGGQTPKLVEFVSLLKQTEIKIYKIMLISFNLQEMKQLVEKLEELKLPDISIKQSSENYLEITSNHAQKARGIKYIQELEQLTKDDMAAFGDGYNDLSMLEMVGTPIVMDNALTGVKDYGKYITKDNDSDGVAYGIQKFLME
ncbi:Cof-type HAD-IIB family hydrolase [Companilactobacillus kimchiensis]|nr:Cof-type HAD-IIB family hydrolase [Companilactobacillus kimchiensis]